MLSVSGVVKAAWEANPRTNGPIQPGRHIYASFCCSPQGQDTWAVQCHHKVITTLSGVLSCQSITAVIDSCSLKSCAYSTTKSLIFIKIYF